MFKYTFVIFIFIVFILTACGIKNNEYTDKVNNLSTNELETLSSISVLSSNEITKYSNLYTDIKLHNWTPNITLPILCPGDVNIETSFNRMLTFSGVTQKQWIDYLEILKDTYSHIDIQDISYDSDENAFGGFRLIDEKSNMYIDMGWYSQLTYYDAEGNLINLNDALVVWCYLGNQTNIDTAKKTIIKNKIIQELNIKDNNNFSLLDVSSKNNIKDGYRVYFLVTPSKYKIDNQSIYMYLCITKDEQILYLDKNQVSLGHNNNEIEFINDDNHPIMYILSYEGDKDTSRSTTGNQLIDKYFLENGKFIHTDTYIVNEIEGCANRIITFEKKDNKIELFEILYDKNSSKQYNEVYTLGNKICTFE